jgi:hypothetical protein
MHKSTDIYTPPPPYHFMTTPIFFFLKCHNDYLWIWLSVTPKHLTLAKATEIVKSHKKSIVEKFNAIVTKRVRNVPLKTSLRKPVLSHYFYFILCSFESFAAFVTDKLYF